MAFNIVDLVKDQITDHLRDQLGSVAGIDTTQTTSALSGAIPGLLTGLTGVANKPGGAGALLDAVNKQDDGLIGNLTSMLGQNQGNQLANEGGNLLSSLLGSGALGTLANVIGGFAGIGRNNSTSLLGILAPIVIGVLKKQVLGSGLDASGLSSMLSSQQSNINAAMPQGLSDQLSNQGFFDSISGASPNVATPTVSAPDLNTPELPKSGGLPKWLIPLVVLGALAYFGYKFLSNQDAPDVSAVGDAATGAVTNVTDGASAAFGSVTDGISTEALDAAKAALPDSVDFDGLTGQLNGAFESTTSALGGITDAESATAALPELTQASEDVSQFAAVFQRLPDAAKGPLSSMLENGMGAVGPLFEKVQAIPGVGAIIEPIVGPMLATIEGLAG